MIDILLLLFIAAASAANLGVSIGILYFVYLNGKGGSHAQSVPGTKPSFISELKKELRERIIGLLGE